MSLTATKTFPPTIYGTTNLPDETKLVVTLTADRPCAPNCGAQANVIVRDKRFTVTHELLAGHLTPGPYKIEVISTVGQPASVQAMIGRSGENLRGPYAATLSRQGWVPPSPNPSEFEKSMGYEVHYVQKITGIKKVAPPPYWHRIEAANAASIAIDMNSISHPFYTNGSADATICIVDNNSCAPWNLRLWRFDCQGHYMDVNSGSDLMIAPERSVAGQLAAIACAG